MPRRLHAYFCGRVQGVGFRFTAREVAESLGITGWVRNLPDGRVELLAEAEEDEIRQLLSQLTRTFAGYVNEVQETWEEPRNEFRGFGVRF